MRTFRYGRVNSGSLAALVAALALTIAAASAAAQTDAPVEEDESMKASPVDVREVVRHEGAEKTKVTAQSGTVSASATATVKIEEEADAAEPYDVLQGADEQTWLALAGWSSKYRIGLNISEGDWVRYRVTDEEPTKTVELRAKRTESGDLWIIEKHGVDGAEGGTEIHMLLASGKPRLLEAFRVDENGNKTQYEIPDEQTAAELVVATRDQAIENVAGDRSKMRIIDCTEDEEITGPFGTLSCRCLEVRVAEDISPLSFARFRPWIPEGTILWMSTSVPRLVPVDAIILPALVSPDETMMVMGGMVRGPGYELIDYSGRVE